MRKRPVGAGLNTNSNQTGNDQNHRETSGHRFQSLRQLRSYLSKYSHVIVVTSIVWVLILSISLALVAQIYSSNHCSRQTPINAVLCGFGQVLIRFCSSSQINEPIFNNQANTKRDNPTSPNDFIPKVKYRDAYVDETCHSGDSCSKSAHLYKIPDSASTINENPSNWPGEMGEPYILPSELEEESKRRFPENMFDIVVSDKIALDRAMPDIRNDHCKAYSKFYQELPNTSIIIVFHNEGNSTLLRTLVSIINRTPWKLIHEIILLDDASVDRDYLREPLEKFIKDLPVKTILLRNEKRLGLISSRVKAAKVATGETIMFLDSHVEVLNGWLLYLLEEIRKDRKTIVCPIIDVLTYDAFQLLHGATDIFGTFSWKMIFRWTKIEDLAVENQAQPIRTPTMAGGLYAIDRLYFEELGMYDEGIKIWGGENLEMSFKCWMCGGKILIHPCSHVAHVFRKETPYKFLESESVFVTIFKNYKRVALVWLDEYRELIYAVNPDIKRLNGGDVTDRLELRRRLNCSSFRHYIQMFKLSNFPLNPRFIGSISVSRDLCLDAMVGPDISKAANTQLLAQDCNEDGGNQIFIYTTTNKIQFDELCLEVGNSKTKGFRSIVFVNCQRDRKDQKWIHDDETSQLKNEAHRDFCLTLLPPSNVVLAKCDSSNQNQQWIFNQEVQLFN